MKLFDIGATVEAAVRGLARFDLDFLTVHGDPHVVRAARQGAAGSPENPRRDGADLARPRGPRRGLTGAGDVAEIAVERAARALAAGADGVIASPREASLIRALPQAAGRLIVTPGVRPAGAEHGRPEADRDPARRGRRRRRPRGRRPPGLRAADPRAAARAIQAELG